MNFAFCLHIVLVIVKYLDFFKGNFFPKLPSQNYEIVILFNIVEKLNNYVFRDDLLPHSPRERGYKLQTLTSAYI